jgi:hypothetical protein
LATVILFGWLPGTGDGPPRRASIHVADAPDDVRLKLKLSRETADFAEFEIAGGDGTKVWVNPSAVWYFRER